MFSNDIYNKHTGVKSFMIVFKKNINLINTIIRFDEQLSLNGYKYMFYPEIGVEVMIITRSAQPYQKINDNKITLLLGDNFEIPDTNIGECMAHASIVVIDTKVGECEILTSIVGLPPVFCYENDKFVVFTSDIFLLKHIPTLKLEFYGKSVMDLCLVGHTTNYNTLFKDVVMLKCGHKITYSNNFGLKHKKNWQFKEHELKYNWEEYCEAQIDQFNRAIEMIELKNCFFSLTAGLDTRAILAAICNIKNDIQVACTISGYPLSLDARIAKKLCDFYGIQHLPIVLNEQFFDNIEKYTHEASRLSGGIYSLEQAHEVFFYESIDRCYLARLSGNMGNQIGRGGTEGVSIRNGNVEILVESFLDFTKCENKENHWFNDMKTAAGGLDFVSLLQDEIPNSSVGNYCIGNYYAVQKSPYAHRGLIEVTAFKPKESLDRTLSLEKMRFKDIKHRVLGDPEERSFQRKLINRHGGFVATCPINWGWRARGGISFPGAVMGIGAVLDSAIEKMNMSNKFVGYLLRACGVSGLHVFKHSDKWMTGYLKDFVCDSIMSESVSAYFNKNIMEEVLNGFFVRNEVEKYSTICFALDLVLAHKNFISE